MTLPPMVPAHELNELHADTAAAVSLAVVGELRDGAHLLLAGLRRAEALAGAEPWAEELAGSYRKALTGYCRRYGLSPSPAPEPSVPEPARPLVPVPATVL
jgi:hypothetical protein